MKPFSFSNLPIPVLAKFCAKVAAALIRPSLRRCNVSALGLLPAVGPGLCLFCADDSESPITPPPDEDDEDEDFVVEVVVAPPAFILLVAVLVVVDDEVPVAFGLVGDSGSSDGRIISSA